MVRPDLLKDVLEALESHGYVSREDFIVREFKNSAGNPALEIEYRYDATLWFRFGIPTKRTTDASVYRFHCTVRPGYESVEESFGAESRTGLKSELREWLCRLYEDVVSLPIGRQLHEHGLAIDQLQARLADLPDEPVSQTDIEAYSEGLEKMKTEFLEQLEKETANTKQVKEKIAALTRDIEFLKRTLASMTKRKWGELLVSRMRQWGNRFPLRRIAAGVKVVQLVVPGETSDILESVAHEVGAVADAVDEPVESRAVDD